MIRNPSREATAVRELAKDRIEEATHELAARPTVDGRADGTNRAANIEEHTQWAVSRLSDAAELLEEDGSADACRGAGELLMAADSLLETSQDLLVTWAAAPEAADELASARDAIDNARGLLRIAGELCDD